YNNNFFVFPDDDVSSQIKTLRYEVDDQYIPTLGLELLMGRNFSEEYGADDESIILNETAVKALGYYGSVCATRFGVIVPPVPVQTVPVIQTGFRFDLCHC